MAKKAKRASKSSSIAGMSIDALFDLRDEIAGAIGARAADLRKQLESLTGSKPRRGHPAGRKSKVAGRKVAAQFRSRKDSKLVWSGRGALPRWMKEEMKGTKLKKENFRIN